MLSSTSTLGDYRTPGDIDIWLFGERKDILRYVRRHVPNCKPVYHHVDFPVIEGLPIEVHFTPSWMNSPFTNRRLQRWFTQFTIDNSQFTISSGAAVNVERGTGNADAELQVKVPLARLIAVSRLVKSCKQRLKHTKCAVKVARRRLRATKSLLYTLNSTQNSYAVTKTLTLTLTITSSRRLRLTSDQRERLTVTKGYFNRAKGALTGTTGASLNTKPSTAL